MGKDLRSFKKERQPVSKEECDQVMKEHPEESEELRSRIKKYEGKSESELMEELRRTTREGKKDGTLNDAQIDNFYEKAAPMMDGEMKKRLDMLIKMMKQE